MDDAHAKTVDEVLNYFGTDSERGLAQDQVKRNQEKYGLNGTILSSQLTSRIVLVTSAAISWAIAPRSGRDVPCLAFNHWRLAKCSPNTQISSGPLEL
ncbi:unnamed protein product [Timema podura]|uniref:Cation-transporting P-type ATPase N-terminal domain-containing protein n=1 Tax=Timema podura TaxID=61482 RepID=A0ABN7NTY9_TIMPD|nr:unnamed protein product [Timema podura]